MAKIGNDNTNVSSTFEQDVELLQGETGISAYVESGWQETKAIAGTLKGWVTNKYDIYTNDEIKDGASYSALQNIVAEREGLQNNIINNTGYTQEERDFELSQINKQYKNKENTLLNQAFEGDDKRAKFDKARHELYDGAGDLTAPEQVTVRVSKEADDIVNGLDKVIATGGLVSDDTLSYKGKIKGTLASELTHLEMNKRKAIADLKSISADNSAIQATIKDYNEIITLQTLISKYALEGANEGILDGDELTDHIISKIGKDKMNRSVELKNNMNLSLQARQAKANIKDGNIGMGLIEYTGLGGAVIAKYLKSGLSFYKSDETKFKGDYSGLQLSDEGGLKYILNYSLDNFDDIASNLVGGAASGGVTGKAVDITGAIASKATRLQKLLDTTVTGKKIADSKITKGVGYFKTQLATGLGANQTINIALNDVNSEERLVADSIMDLAMGPIFDGILSAAGHPIGKATDSFLNSQLMENFTLTKSKVIDEFQAKGISREEAEKLFLSTQDYLAKTSTNKTNKDIFKFITDNETRLTDEGTVVGNGMVMTMRQYQNKTYNALDVNVDAHKDVLTKEGSIVLTDNTIQALDIKDIFKKVNLLSIGKTPEVTVKKLLATSGVKATDIKSFIKQNRKIVESLHKTILETKQEVELFNLESVLTTDNSPLQKIGDLSEILNTLTTKLSTPETLVKIYLPETINGATVFNEKIVKKSELKIDGYEVIYNSNGKDNPVFINNTLRDKIKDGVERIETQGARSLLANGYVPESGIDSLDDLLSDLSSIFGYDIELDGTRLLSLTKKDGVYYFNTSITNKIVDANKGASIKMNNKTLAITHSTINKALLNSLLNVTDRYIPGQLKDVLSSTSIKLTRAIKDGAKVDNVFSALTLDEVSTIASKNVNELLKDLFTESELKSYNKIINDTILTKGALEKLFVLGDMGSKKTNSALGALVEGLMLRVAERYSQAPIKKLIANVVNDTDINLSQANKTDAINNILLGETPINAFKYVGEKSAWNISAKNSKLLGIIPDSEIFQVSKEATERFIESIVDRKTKIGTSSTEQIKAIEEGLKKQFDNNVEVATSIYTDNVLRAALNEKGIDQVLANLKTRKGIEGELDYAAQIQDVIDEGLLPGETNIKVTDIINSIGDTISDIQFTKINTLVEQLRLTSNKAKGDNTDTLAFLVENMNKFTTIINNGLDIELDNIGSQYTYTSQTTGGDNILKKSLNYLLNPYTGSQVFDVQTAEVLDSFITDNILKSNEFSKEAYKGKSLLELTNLAKATDGDAATYQKEVESAMKKIRAFIYPQPKNFKIDTKTSGLLAKRDEVTKKLVDSVIDSIVKNDGISILTKDGKVAVGKVKGDIVRKGINEWSIINSLQQRLTKRNFEGYKISFKKDGSPTKIEGIEEYRTMYSHFHNAGNIKGNIKPLILEGNDKINGTGMVSREHYRIANNLVGWFNTKSKQFHTNKKELKNQLDKYLQKISGDDDVSAASDMILNKATSMSATNEYVDGFINLMNVGDKDSFGAYTESFVSSTVKGKIKGKELINDFSDFMAYNDKQFTDDMVKELNMDPSDLVKVAKRIATITAEAETLLPGSAITIRNYILEEPEYIDAVLQGTDIEKDSLFVEEYKDGKKVYNTLNTLGQDYILNRFQKELNGFKDNFHQTDFKQYNKAIVDLLTTPYSDGVSFLHPDQIKFYSNYQSHIDSRGKNPIKMHHYSQDKDWSVLYKTNFNSYTDDMLSQIQALDLDKADISNTRLIGAESEKLKTYGKPIEKLKGDKFIVINGVSHKVKGYVDTDTSFDKHASSESETHAEANGITKQADTRTHPAASEFILKTKQALIAETIDELKREFGLNKKLDSTMFNSFEDFSNYILNETGIESSSLGTINNFLKNKLKSLGSLIETPKDEGLGFRGIMQPRINRVEGGKIIPIADDELVVSVDRFNTMKDKMLEIDGEYYVSTYRNPVPNTENMTINKVVVDESMVSMEDVAIGSWNVFVNKQADFDGDHLNITYINNPKYIGDSNGKGKQLGGLGIALGTILNIEDGRKALGLSSAERNTINEELINKIYTTKDAVGLQEEITKFTSDWIKEQGDNGIAQKRVPVGQVNKDAVESIIETAKDTDTKSIKDIANDRFKVKVTELLNSRGIDIKVKKKLLEAYGSSNTLKDFRSKISLKSLTGKKLTKPQQEIVKEFYAIVELKQKFIAKLGVDKKQATGGTLTKASNNAITGKDNISNVDSFIRTLDLVRKYGWEYNNAELLGKTKEDIIADYREGLDFTLENKRKRLDGLLKKSEVTKLSKWEENSKALLEEEVLQGEQTISLMASYLGDTTKDIDYKSIAAELEQQTLDLAHAGLDKLPEGWENKLLGIVYKDIEPELLQQFLKPIGMNTSKVYNMIGDNKVLGYGRKWSNELQTLVDLDLPLLGQHKALHKTLRKEIEFIYDKLSTISSVAADKHFFGFFNDATFKVKALELLAPYRVTTGLRDLIKDPTAKVEGWITDSKFTYLPGVTKIYDKSLGKRGRYSYVVEEPDLLKKYMEGKKLPGIKGGEIINEESLNTFMMNAPFPGVTSIKEGTKYFKEIKKENLKTFQKAVSEISSHPLVEYDSGMTSIMYADILATGKTLSDKYIKAKGFTPIKKGDSYEITINDKDKKGDVINKMLNKLGITGKNRNPILLKNDLPLDLDSLSRAEQLNLIYTHFILKDADLKDLKNNPDAIANRANDNLNTVIKRTEEKNLSIEQQSELISLQKELELEPGAINLLGSEYIVKSNEDLGAYIEVEGEQYNIDKRGDGQYSIYKTGDTPYYRTDDKEAQATLDNLQLQSKPGRREYDLIKNLGLGTNDLKFVSEKMDKVIDDIGNFTTRLMSTKTMKIFKDLMIRNQELTNNATYDLYEDFTHIQKNYSTMDKIRRRQIDNHLFMNIYKGRGGVSEKEADIYRTDYDDIDRSYYDDIHKFVMGHNTKGQSIKEIFERLEIDLTKTIRGKDNKVVNINDAITSSLIEDIVNLRHKTQKIAFYEEGIHDYKTFEAAYRKRSEEQGLDINKEDMQNIYDVIFEYDYIKKESLNKAINLMRGTTFSTTLGAFSWFTGAAGFTMGLMQMPSELLRLGSMSKHRYGLDELTKVMDDYKILKSTGIEAGIHFGPIEAKPGKIHGLTYDALTLGKPREGLWNASAKNISALIANPLIITDMTVDAARKRTALGNVMHTLGFESVESFKSYIDTLPRTESTDLLNRIRLGAELKYHELSGGVTAGSALFRETTFARTKSMIPFSYLMNWALHTMSTALGSAKQSLSGMKDIYHGDIKQGLKSIQDSNMLQKSVGQSLVIAGLYAKLNSHDEYDGEFKTKKDMFEFIKTLNSNILSLEMFWPLKAMEKAYEQEGGMIGKLATGLGTISGSTFRELDLLGIIAEEAWTSYNTPGYNAWEAITTALLTKGSKGLAFSKMIEVESQFPEFSRRALIDQMMGADNPNFDESLYKSLYSEAKGERIEALWNSGNPHIILGEIASAIPIIRHLSNMSDGGNSYAFYDKQVREVNKRLTDGTYDVFYKNPELMINSLYIDGNIDRVWTYANKFSSKYGKIDFADKDLVSTQLSKLIPEIKYNSYGQLTESIMVGEMLNELGVDGYIKTIGTGSENNKYIKQLLAKIQTESPAKLPYVLSILLQNDYSDETYAFKKNKIDIDTNTEEAIKVQLLLKYKDLIKASNPMMAQMMGYQVASDNSELKDIMMSSSGYLSEHIADRITTRLMMTEAYEKGENHAAYIGSRFGGITNKLTRQFTDGDIDEGHFKTALLDLYRVADDSIQEGNFTPDQKLEIKTALYKSLDENAYVLYEDKKLGEAYESSRINLAHRLYKHSSTLEQYAKDAQLKGSKWDITNPDIGTSQGERYKNTYRNTNLVRTYSSGGGSKSYGNGYIQGAGNNINRMLGNPKTNFRKIFRPTYNPYSGTPYTPFGFRFTTNDERIFIEYFRNVTSPQYSKDLFEKKGYASKGKVFRTSRRKAELTKQEQKNIGRQNFRGFLSKGLMRDLPGSKL